MSTTVRTVLEEKGTKVHTVDPRSTVLEAVRTMNEANIGAVLVVGAGEQSDAGAAERPFNMDGTPIGIFTERDVLTRIIGLGRDPNRTRITEVMTTNIVVLGPDTTIQQALAVCTEKRCRHLPVMKGNEILGLISAGDLTSRMADLQAKEIGSLIRYITGQYPG